MIYVVTIVTLSKEEIYNELVAFSQNVYTFLLRGDTTFTDSQAVEWFWNGVQDPSITAPVIQGVRADNIQLVEVFSLADCTNNAGTFFYASPQLYVHYSFNQHDYSIQSSSKFLQEVGTFLSSRMDRHGQGYYGNTYYEPTALSFSGFSLRADPLKLGVVASAKSSVSVQNGRGKYDNVSDRTTLGSVAQVLTVADGEQNLANANVVFKGFTRGADYNQESIDFSIIEQRFFLDVPLCPNVALVSDFPSIARRFENKPIPVAFGDVTTGRILPIDSDGATNDASSTITAIIADPALAQTLNIGTVQLYDDQDEELTITGTNASLNQITFTKPAGTSVRFDQYRWEGQGYDLGAGLTYNNGLDIMRFAFTEIVGLTFAEGVFDLQTWNDATLVNNQAIGIARATTKGLTRELLEPITVSLQGVILSRGDGRLTFVDRNISASPKRTIEVADRLGGASIEYDTDSVVSALTVEYGDGEQIEDDSQRQTVVDTFGIDTREPLSPVETVLANSTDADAIATEILATSTTPDRILSVRIKYTLDFDLNPFDIIDIDAGRYDAPDFKRCEVLQINPDYNRYEVAITARVLADIDEPIDIADGGGVIAGASVDIANAGGAVEITATRINGGDA